jgi:hypothetical protein
MRTHSLEGERMGDQIQTTGQKLWYSIQYNPFTHILYLKFKVFVDGNTKMDIIIQMGYCIYKQENVIYFNQGLL